MSPELSYLEELKNKLTDPLHIRIFETYLKNDPNSNVLSELVKIIKDLNENQKP